MEYRGIRISFASSPIRRGESESSSDEDERGNGLPHDVGVGDFPTESAEHIFTEGCCDEKCIFLRHVREEIESIRKASLRLDAVDRRRNLRTAVFLSRMATSRGNTHADGSPVMDFVFEIASGMAVCERAFLYALGYSPPPRAQGLDRHKEFAEARAAAISGAGMLPVKNADTAKRSAKSNQSTEAQALVHNFVRNLGLSIGHAVLVDSDEAHYRALPPKLSMRSIYKRYSRGFHTKTIDLFQGGSAGHTSVAPRLSPELRVSRSEFEDIWKGSEEMIGVLLPRKDPCRSCREMLDQEQTVSRAPHQRSWESDLQELLLKHRSHLEYTHQLNEENAQLAERARVIESSSAASSGETGAEALDEGMVSLDWVQAALLPLRPSNPDPLLHLQPYELHMLGGTNEGTQRGMLYLVREEVMRGMSSSDAALSLLHHMLDREGAADPPSRRWYRRLVVRADGVSPHNETTSRVAYWIYRVACGHQEEIEERLTPVGHGRREAPPLFAPCAEALSRLHAATPAQVHQGLRETCRDALVAFVPDVDVGFFQWSRFLDTLQLREIAQSKLEIQGVRVTGTGAEVPGVRISVQTSHSSVWEDVTSDILPRMDRHVVTHFVEGNTVRLPEQFHDHFAPLDHQRYQGLATVAATASDAVRGMEHSADTWHSGPWSAVDGIPSMFSAGVSAASAAAGEGAAAMAGGSSLGV